MGTVPTASTRSNDRSQQCGRLNGRRDGRLAVTCWCERAVVHVEADVVWNGRTASCGRPGCLPVAVAVAGVR